MYDIVKNNIRKSKRNKRFRLFIVYELIYFLIESFIFLSIVYLGILFIIC